MNIFYAFTSINTDAKLSKYLVFKHKKIIGPLVKNVFMIITLEEFIISNKIVTLEDVLRST